MMAVCTGESTLAVTGRGEEDLEEGYGTREEINIVYGRAGIYEAAVKYCMNMDPGF